MSAVNLGSLKLSSNVMNAAGPWASNIEQLQSIYKSESGAVVTKSFTIEPCRGNEEPNMYFEDGISINSVGLANRGAAYFIEAVSQLGDDKPIIASIAESSTNRFVELTKQIGDSAFSAIELNVSCPNVKDKEAVAYSPTLLDELLSGVLENTNLPVGVKLPQFVTEKQFIKTAGVLALHDINHIVLINTIPFAYASNEGRPALKPNKGIGGLGGVALKPVALGHIIEFRDRLPLIPIVGVGGIQTQEDINDFIDVGATAVQLGTVIEKQGIEKLNTILA